MESSRYMTPYEKYVRENIDAERKRIDDLYTEFAHSGALRKEMIKRQIDEANENIELLSRDLAKYSSGLTWLREPSKERDEKAEHLDKIQEEPPAPKPAAAAPATPASRPTVGTPRPSVGTPVGAKPAVGTPRPSVGTPVGKPTVGAPVGTPRPQVGTPVGTPRPTVGTPVGTRPTVGTPKAETPAAAEAPQNKPQVGVPISQRPRVGTPKTEEKKESETTS